MQSNIQHRAAETVPASTTEPAAQMALAHQICALMHDAENGVAVFNSGYQLLSSNPAYRRFRGLAEGTVETGVTLREVITRSLLPAGHSSQTIKEIIETDLERLTINKTDSFNAISSAGLEIRVSRHFNASKLLVETISPNRAVQNPALEDPTTRISELRKGQSRLMSAMENMSDGFALFDVEGVLVSFNERYRELQLNRPQFPGGCLV